jgi:hypothetical protein
MPEADPKFGLVRYARNEAVEAFSRGDYVSVPITCRECRALVRYTGDRDHRGSWRCPVCRVALPYTFWNIKQEAATVRRTLTVDDLVQRLHPEACDECGEANPPCLCERRAEVENPAQAQAMKALRALKAEPNSDPK